MHSRSLTRTHILQNVAKTPSGKYWEISGESERRITVYVLEFFIFTTLFHRTSSFLMIRSIISSPSITRNSSSKNFQHTPQSFTFLNSWTTYFLTNSNRFENIFSNIEPSLSSFNSSTQHLCRMFTREHSAWSPEISPHTSILHPSHFSTYFLTNTNRFENIFSNIEPSLSSFNSSTQHLYRMFAREHSAWSPEISPRTSILHISLHIF